MVLFVLLVEFIYLVFGGEDMCGDSDLSGHHYPSDQQCGLPIFSINFCYNTSHIRSVYFF